MSPRDQTLELSHCSASRSADEMESDTATIERLHQRYAGVLYDKSLRMLGDEGEAEDAVQDTFASAFRSLKMFRYGDSHLPWLFRICTNVCLKVIRKNERKGFTPVARVPEPLHLPRLDLMLDCRRVIFQLAGDLDERSMAIFVAHYVDGMNQGQVAEQLGVSRRAVVKRLTAIRRRLAQLTDFDDD